MLHRLDVNIIDKKNNDCHFNFSEAALSTSLKPHLVPLWIWNATGENDEEI